MKNKIEELINNGVIFIDKNNVYIGDNVKIGKNTTIYPFTYIADNIVIGENCTIQCSSMLINNIKLFNNVFIGPYTLLRENVIIGEKTSIGPHCEITRSVLGVNCKIGHKNFIGDATLLDNVKFGAGAIIANSDWNTTYKTFIGENSLIGCNSTIIAPRKIGNNSLIAAGSTITNDIDDNQLGIARSLQVNKERKKK